MDYVGLRQIADVADRNSLLGRNVEDEETVGVGRGTDVGVLDVNGGSDQRGSVGVGDGTGDTMLFRSRGTLGGSARTLSVRCAASTARNNRRSGPAPKIL